MVEESISEFIIPARSGRAFEIKKGQILRIIETEGKQVADVNAWNLHDFRERMDALSSMFMSHNFKRVDKVYSNRYNLMFTVIEDRVGVNFFGSHCAPAMYEAVYGKEHHYEVKGHPYEVKGTPIAMIFWRKA